MVKLIGLDKILTKGKAFYLAYDQGIEHGPSDFNDENVNPLRIIEIARKGGFNGLIVQKGIAEKYYKEIKKSKVPLILKLNGKTNLYKGEPLSRQLCSIKEALELGATAVGYTIYLGSKYEPIMLKEFEKIEEDAHDLGLPVIAWLYPRGKSVEKLDKAKLMVYAARVGLEIGADIAKISYHGSVKDLKWAVKSAGRTKVVIAGGLKENEKNLLKKAREIMRCGCTGMAVGRNVWQDKSPLEMARELRKIILG
jgi:class I fructose-bisphosphate aldolase